MLYIIRPITGSIGDVDKYLGQDNSCKITVAKQHPGAFLAATVWSGLVSGVATAHMYL